ncbi:MAG: aminodeoxychorismate/anthranilate synthase component II [Phycisphaeraceae bacterium]|nr:aminodeoxychorismate/anthranilate synthase component II [Phycisphaeraceae bacterium]
MLLLIDNYDSFTFNLAHAFLVLRPEIEVKVVRNDAITLAEARALAPSHLVISPGPCTPRESGISPELIEAFRGVIPILGVCLGHQAIGACHGMTVRRNSRAVHGKTSMIRHDGRGIFEGVPNPFQATRYHSLIVDRATVTPDFEVSAWTEEDEVMGLRWRGSKNPSAPLDGVQFHPESYLTHDGPRLLENFLKSAVQRDESHSKRRDASSAV